MTDFGPRLTATITRKQSRTIAAFALSLIALRDSLRPDQASGSKLSGRSQMQQVEASGYARRARADEHSQLVRMDGRSAVLPAILTLGMTTCAYCLSTGPLTREHIWPRSFIERLPGYSARYAGAAHKFVQGELTVRDVCAKCNSGPLSSLDSYASKLLDKSWAQIPRPGEELTMAYDYDLLVRWLVKVSYNASRASGVADPFLPPLSGYILGTLPRPEDLSVLLHIVGTESTALPPLSVRAGRVQIPVDTSWLSLRLISINSFYFFIVITSPTVEAPSADIVTDIVKCLPRTRLAPDADEVNLRAASDDVDWLHRFLSSAGHTAFPSL